MRALNTLLGTWSLTLWTDIGGIENFYGRMKCKFVIYFGLSGFKVEERLEGIKAICINQRPNFKQTSPIYYPHL